MANLFIGLGGSGIKTLNYLKQKQSKAQAQDNHFLYIDTDSREFVGMNPDDYLDLGEANVVNFIENSAKTEERKKLDEWFDPACRSILTNGPLKQGASAIRPQGRAAVAEFYKQFELIVTRKLDILTNLINNTASKEVNVYIVLSCAGGTGSSIYIDLSYLINNSIISKNIATQGIQYSPWLIYYMPDGFVKFHSDKEWIKRDYRTNIYAAWKEVDAVLRDYYVNNAGSINTDGSTNISNKGISYFKDFVIGKDKINSSNFQFQLFQNAVLVDYQNETGKIISIEDGQLYKNISQFLLYISDPSFGGAVRSDYNNTIRRNASESLKSGAKWLKHFTAAGYTEIRGGGFLFDNYVQLNLKKYVFEGLIGNLNDDKHDVYEKILTNELYNRIEVDNFEGRGNKSISTIPNPHVIINKILSKIDKSYNDLTNATEKEDVLISIDSIKTQFNASKDLFESNYKSELVKEGFEVKKTAKEFLKQAYVKFSDLVISEGLLSVQTNLDKLDEEIDKLYSKYDLDYKSIENKKVLNNDSICNKDLLKEIDTLYNQIKNGEDAPFFKKDEWYVTKLTNYVDLIKSYIKYKSEVVLIESKRDVCFEISQGESKEIEARKRVRDLISKFRTYIDVDLKKDKEKLIGQFRNYTDDPLSRIIPDVSKFASDFDNPDINEFRNLLINQCGLSFTNKIDTITLDRKKDVTSNLTSIENLINSILDDKKDFLTSFLDGTISSEVLFNKFIELSTKTFETQNLRSILPAYSAISNLSLKDWVVKYPSDFDRYKTDFVDRAKLFCSLNTAQLKVVNYWISNNNNKTLVDDIINNNKSNHANIKQRIYNTEEDVVAMLKLADNISLDDYTNFVHYKDHYADSIKNIPDSIFPHIDVRFKNEIKKYPNSTDDNKIINKMMEDLTIGSGLVSPSSNSNKLNTDKFAVAFKNYSKLYLLNKFYSLLRENNFKTNLLIDSTSKIEGNDSGYPIFSTGNEICFYQTQTKPWNTLFFDTIDEKSTFTIYSKDLLISDFRKSSYPPNEEIESWNILSVYSNLLDEQIRLIKFVKVSEAASCKSIFEDCNKKALEDYEKHILEILPDAEESSKILRNIRREVFDTFKL